MILKFMFKGAWNESVAHNKGYAENHFLVLDTDNKTFSYCVTPWVGDDTYIKIPKLNLLKIMDEAQKSGYALKIGG